MSPLCTLAQSFPSPIVMLIIGVPVMIVLFLMLFFISRYKRCPSNRILVVYGRVGGERTARCVHGGGVMVWPVVQAHAFLSLEPKTIEIELVGALSLQNIRVNVPSTFTIGISTHPEIMQNAAERLLGLSEKEISDQASDIILGQMRLVIATMDIEEINQDREKFLELINKNVGFELNKIGLDMINVNIRDITDESGYITAIGKKAAAEAINQAKVEVAEAERTGAIGEATANREREVEVAAQQARTAEGQKEAERDRRIAVAKLEAEGVAGEASSRREQDIAIAEQEARTAEGRKGAESQQRVRVAGLEAEAIEGENQSKASIADYEAGLDERRAEAQRRGEVATANSRRDVLLAEREQEIARMEKEVLARETIERRQVEINAEAEAERTRRVARGEADAILARYNAEAEGLQAVLNAKAEGYEQLLRTCGERVDLAPTLLLVEKLPELIAEQVKAIQNLRIDKITVWDTPGAAGGGNGRAGGGRSTADFLSSMIGSLPPIHELAEQAGVELPELLGRIRDNARPTGNDRPAASPDDSEAEAEGDGADRRRG